MILEGLKNGRYFVEEGIVSTLTPFTKIDDIEEELRKEIEDRMKGEINKEIVVREFGRVIGFITENNWKVFYPDKKAETVVIAAPFNGGEMVNRVISTQIDEETKEKKTIEVVKDRVYIPSGYLTIHLRIGNFPSITSSTYRIIPNLRGRTVEDVYNSEEGELFLEIHPHTDGLYLCSGLTQPSKFDIDYIIELLRAGILGSKKEKGSSIWDYNATSPLRNMETCKYGALALQLFEKGLSDQEIWNRIIEARKGKRGGDQ